MAHISPIRITRLRSRRLRLPRLFRRRSLLMIANKISGTGVALFQAIEQSVSRPLASGRCDFSTPKSQRPRITAFFPRSRLPAPGILLRNVNAQGSMAGIMNVGGGQSPFFILSVTSYSDTFSGMLRGNRQCRMISRRFSLHTQRRLRLLPRRPQLSNSRDHQPKSATKAQQRSQQHRYHQRRRPLFQCYRRFP